MKLSTKGRYGLRLMLDLALHYGQGFIFLKDIASRQEISEKYLWQLISPLKNEGLINSIRGANGGYELAKHPSKINLKEIITILEGPIIISDDNENQDILSIENISVSRDIFNEITSKVEKILESYTLDYLTERQKNKEGLGSYII